MKLISRKEAKEQGLKRYFTGKPCKNGHASERLLSNGNCLECAAPRKREYMRDRYRENKVEINSHRRKVWAEKNSDRIEFRKNFKQCSLCKAVKPRNNFYFRNNELKISSSRCIECSKALRKEHYLENRDKCMETSKAWKRANRDSQREYRRRTWRLYYNPDKGREYNHKRRAIMKGAEGHHTADDIKALIWSQANTCACCGDNFDDTGYHVDHMVPLSKGGSNWPHNLQLLCPTCNLSKGDKDYFQWLADVGRANVEASS